MTVIIVFFSVGLAHYVQSQIIINGKELYPYDKWRERNSRAKEISALRQSLFQSNTDSSRLLHLCDLASVYNEIQNDSAQYFAEYAKKIALTINKPWALIRVYRELGNVHGTTGSRDLDKSLEYYTEMASQAEKNENQKEIHDAFSCILNLCFYKGDYPKAMQTTARGLSHAEQSNDHEKIAYYFNLFGFIHLHQGNLPESRKAFEKYYSEAATIGDSLKMADAKIGLGEVFLSEKNTDAALALFNEVSGFLIRKFSTNETLLKTEKVPYVLFKTSMAYQAEGDLDNALKYCLKAFSYSHKFPFNTYDLASYYIGTGNVYLQSGNNEMAVRLANEGLALSKKIEHAENTRDAYRLLADIFVVQNRFDSAYYYEKLYSQLKENIINGRTLSEIEQINTRFLIEKKDREIAQQRALHDIKINRQKAVAIALVSALLMIIVIGSLLYNRYRLKQKAEFQQELNRRQKDLFNIVTTTQDNERKRIAQDIHDNLGSILSAAKLQLSGLEESTGKLTPDGMKKYEATISLMDQAVEELRNVSQAIMPSTLTKLGLIAALRNLFDKIADKNSIQVSFSTHGVDKRLEESIEIGLYPVMLELMNNILKHANATAVTIQIIRYPDHINVLVEDNGKGFVFNEKDIQTKGIGLGSLFSRIQSLKGKLDIDSTPGKGTTVSIDLPSVNTGYMVLLCAIILL